MKPIYLSVLLAIFLPVFCLAQSNFKPGYFVDLKNDTIKGDVDQREWGLNPKTIRFKAQDGVIKELSPANTNAVGIYGQDQYASFNMPISLNETELSRLPRGYDSSKVTLPVFLKKIAAGNVLTLYTYTDNIKVRFIIKEKSAAIPEELTYQVYYDKDNDYNLKTVYGFRPQLLRCAFVYKKNDNSLVSKIQNANYNASDIVRIVNLINDQKENSSIASGGSNIRFMVGAAYALSSFSTTFSGPYPTGYRGGQSVAFPQVSIGIDGFLNPNTRRLISRLELTYIPYHAISVLTTAAVIPFSLKQQAFLISPQVLYNFYNAPLLKVFGGTGINLSFNTTKNADGSAYTPSEPNWRKFYAQIPFKAGVVLDGKFEIYANYVLPVGLNYSNSNVINMTVYKAGINFLFGPQ